MIQRFLNGQWAVLTEQDAVVDPTPAPATERSAELFVKDMAPKQGATAPREPVNHTVELVEHVEVLAEI